MFDWRTYGTYGIAVFFGFILRWVNERRRNRQVDTRFQFVCSVVVSYFAYIWHRDQRITFLSIDIWLGIWSYFGSLAVSVGDNFFVFGWKAYLRIVLNNLMNSLTLKDHKNESIDIDRK